VNSAKHCSHCTVQRKLNDRKRKRKQKCL